MVRHLEGKVAAVTGGGRGIGREVCRLSPPRAPQWSSTISGFQSRDRKKPCRRPDDVAKEIKAAGGNAASNHLDISTPEGGEGLVDHAIKEFGKLDILVNVAGILRDRMNFQHDDRRMGRGGPGSSARPFLHHAPGQRAYARAQIRPHH